VDDQYDVIVVGAGLSGVGAAYHLQTRGPHKTFAILESRTTIGGTWDLFRYPGVRSDSDMFTLGYRWKPWLGHKAVADGASILDYVRETARENGIDRKIKFEHRVVRAVWSSERSLWSLEVECGARRELRRFSCRFLYMCTGYYAYDAGYTPQFEGLGDFQGRVVHAQQWNDGVEYAGKRVVVIGSGATAMTLVPELAKHAAHVTMLQRSPTYVISASAVDRMANLLRRLLPASWAYALVRWRNILFSVLFFQLIKLAPAFAKNRLLGEVRRALGPGYDVEKHFTPRYDVWDQRLCLIPDDDLFDAIRDQRASVVTDHIARFTPTGIALQSQPEELAADLVVMATGLDLMFLGNIELSVDGRRIEPNQHLNYKGCMFSDVPNLAYTFGYTNASWTLKADLVAEYVCRVLAHMDATGATRCTPRRRDLTMGELPWLDFSSGYVLRTLARFPKQGSKAPFRLYQNYLLDLLTLRFGAIDDGSLELVPAPGDRASTRAAKLPSTTSDSV
jgi:cation diffusion facilitator CzcD-associated flavoprotein CzcO